MGGGAGMKRTFLRDYETICRTRGCENENHPIRLAQWDGSTVICGPCGSVSVEQADWYVPPTDEELGIEPPAQRAAELIAQMTDAERAELAALIAPKPPTLGQEAKQ